MNYINTHTHTYGQPHNLCWKSNDMNPPLSCLIYFSYKACNIDPINASSEHYVFLRLRNLPAGFISSVYYPSRELLVNLQWSRENMIPQTKQQRRKSGCQTTKTQTHTQHSQRIARQAEKLNKLPFWRPHTFKCYFPIEFTELNQRKYGNRSTNKPYKTDILSPFLCWIYRRGENADSGGLG